MVKPFVRKLSIFVISLFLLILQPVSILACGMSIVPSESGWTYGNDSAEQSFIAFENGIEKLVISRNFTNGPNNTVWIIPVPSRPEEVNIDVLSDTPSFSGYDVEKKAHQNLGVIYRSLLATQIYPIFPISFFNTMVGVNTLSLQPAGSFDKLGNAVGMDNQIVVYEHLEKNGMIAEVLSASNSDALYGYFSDKGLKVEKNSIAILQEYIGTDFSFVASWVNPSSDRTSAKGLLMTFPTKKMFYPLKPESGTPGSGMPETITVVGFVTPKLFGNIKDSTKVNYYYSENTMESDGFYSNLKGFGFTKIVITTKPSNLTEDLYVSKIAPIKILNAQFINLYILAYSALMLIIVSTLSTYITLRLVLPENKGVFLKLSVSNCFSILGTIFGAFKFLRERRLKYVISFSLIFVGVSTICWYLLQLLYK